MRQGEFLGLHWKAIDFEEGLLHVMQNVQRRKREWRLKDLKTDSCRRPIGLARMAIAAICQHRARQEEIRTRADGTWQDMGLVFCDVTGGPLKGKNVTVKYFYPLLKKTGIEIEDFHFHDLRHTAGSLYMAMGVSPKVIQEMMGHSTVAMTLDTYSHPLPDLQARQWPRWTNSSDLHSSKSNPAKAKTHKMPRLAYSGPIPSSGSHAWSTYRVTKHSFQPWMKNGSQGSWAHSISAASSGSSCRYCSERNAFALSTLVKIPMHGPPSSGPIPCPSH